MKEQADRTNKWYIIKVHDDYILATFVEGNEIGGEEAGSQEIAVMPLNPFERGRTSPPPSGVSGIVHEVSVSKEARSGEEIRALFKGEPKETPSNKTQKGG